MTDKYTILIFETTSFAAIKIICRPLCMYSNALMLVRDPRSVVYLELNFIRFQASVCFISDELAHSSGFYSTRKSRPVKEA